MTTPWEALVAAALLALGLASPSPRLERIVAAALLYAIVPVVAGYKVATAPLTLVGGYAAQVAASMLGSLALAGLLVPRLLRGHPRETVGAAVLAAGIHNAGFLPIPLITVLYGDPGPPALYSAMANVYMSIAIPLIVARYSPRISRGSHTAPARVARSLAGYPPLHAVAAGAAARLLGLDPTPLQPLYHAAAAATLASFYLVGSTLARSGLGLDKPVAVIAAWRLLVEPAIAAPTAKLLGLQGVWHATALIEATMPPATMNLVVARVYSLDEKTVAKAIGLVTPISIAAAAAVRLLNPPP